LGYDAPPRLVASRAAERRGLDLQSAASNLGKVGHEQVDRRVPGGGLDALLEGFVLLARVCTSR
jgi:hypothetical protein